MKKRLQLLILILFTVQLTILSCKNLDKENEIIENVSEEIDDKANSQFLTDVADLNLKVLVLTKTAFEYNLNDNTEKIIKEIENHHEADNKKIKAIAKKNLIIIPDTIYNTNSVINNSEITKDYEILLELEELLKNEINQFTKVEKYTQNEEIKKFAQESITKINSNIENINSVLN